MPRLTDYADLQGAEAPLRLGDILDQEVTVTEVRFFQAEFGRCAIMTVIDENGEILRVMCGGFLVVDALEHAAEANAFPLDVTFSKRERTWVME